MCFEEPLVGLVKLLPRESSLPLQCTVERTFGRIIGCALSSYGVVVKPNQVGLIVPCKYSLHPESCATNGGSSRQANMERTP